MMNRLAELLVVIALVGGIAYTGPVAAQTLKKEPDMHELSCGKKVLVENNTCPAGQILEITGSCLDAIRANDASPRGRQYNCIKRK